MILDIRTEWLKQNGYLKGPWGPSSHQNSHSSTRFHHCLPIITVCWGSPCMFEQS